ncbi:protein Gir2p [[Candida] anglica]|uniref:Protein Gir2p n=1 Tax=[Candida] anglica TaxID=148631 RepID=A0ABP0E7F8_9ASCO
MDALEEQTQELEVLQSIYPDELEILSETHFTVRLNLDTNTDRKHALVLEVKYPAEYPEVVPVLDIEVGEDEEDEDDYYGSDDDDDIDSDEERNRQAVNLAESIDFEKKDLSTLLDKINEEAEMNLGMPSVFALTSQLKEEAEQLFQNKIDAAQRKYDRELVEREMEEQKKFNGTKVTRESWLEWRNKFREEMKVAEKDKALFDAMHNGKMSGREIFEKGLAGDEDETVDSVTEAVKETQI